MGSIQKYIENADFADTGFSYTMSLISGKHKMVILYCLMEFEPVRFNEMKRYLGKITDTTLSNNLKELENDDLIIRKEYSQIPPKVEYFLFVQFTVDDVQFFLSLGADVGVVGDHEDRVSLTVQLFKEREHILARLAVQSACRLVCQK